jgi:predicted RNase H-like HicB family nuclease
MRNEFTVVIEPPTDGDAWFIAYCPEIPEANGQGRTKEEVLESLREGIALALEMRREEGLRGVTAKVIRETIVVERSETIYSVTSGGTAAGFYARAGRIRCGSILPPVHASRFHDNEIDNRLAQTICRRLRIPIIGRHNGAVA